MNQEEIVKKVNGYYSDKIKAHGPTPGGVDWNGYESQYTRFEQLIRLVDVEQPFLVADLGCGYGEMIKFFDSRALNYRYIGYDLSDEMIEAGQRQFGTESKIQFKKIEGTSELLPVEYVVASGIFNVKLDVSEDEWLAYVLDTIKIMYEKSEKGIAFNMLTSYSDEEFKKDHLYYANPMYIFDYLKKNVSFNVAVLHDYGLYEFTVLVRK